MKKGTRRCPDHAAGTDPRGSVAATATAAATTTVAAATTAAATPTAATAAVGAAATAATTAATVGAAATAAASTASATSATAAATTGATTTTTAAVAATAATAAGTATAATEATWALFTRTGFVDHDGATVDGLAVHAIDGSLRFRIRAHFHKAEALGTARFTVHHDLGGSHGAKLRKSLQQRVIANRIGQITDVKFVSHGEPSKVPRKTMWSSTLREPIKRKVRLPDTDSVLSHPIPTAVKPALSKI